MKSSRQIEKIVGRARARAGQATDERILTDAGDALANPSLNRPQALRPGPTIWRIIMESKVTRYSAAAVVALAIGLVLLGPFGTSKNGSIVWAEVVEKVSEMRTVVHKSEYVFSEIGQEEPGLEADTVRFDTVKYLSEECGIAEDVSEEGTLIAQVYFLAETHQGMIVSHTEKRYGKVSLPEHLSNRITEIITPRGLVEYFISGHYTKLGRAKFDNFDVEGFETTDPNVLLPFPKSLHPLFPITDIVARIWVDVETSLPVGIAAEFNTGRGLLTGFTKLHGEWRAYDFQWNAEIPEGIFEPNIPDDYTEFKVTDLIPPEAKAGLAGLVAIPAGFVFWKRRRKKRTTTDSD